jgi:predicted RNA methylase
MRESARPVRPSPLSRFFSMNAKSVSAATTVAAPVAVSSVQASSGVDALAANLLLADLARGIAIDARALRTAMIASFGASDAEGAWNWKTAYEACEAAQILFLRKFGPAMRERAVSPSRNLAMLARLAALVPTHTRRSEESQALQQFSTPIALGFVASTAAAITPADLVLEPSAGTGLLAIHAELAGGKLVLNEIADIRAGLLDRLFPGAGVTRYDAAHIHDHLEAAVRPSVVLMNPPFSVAAHVDGRVADAALRHLSSALARLADGGRLVAITGASLSPDNPSWRDGFIRLQERGRLVFSAAVDGRVYARHGTTGASPIAWACRSPSRPQWSRIRTAGRDDMAITSAKNEDVTEQVLEIVQQALDGLWTAEEMTRKIEQITGGKIERG